MKYLILIGLFLVGCSYDDKFISLAEKVNILSTKIDSIDRALSDLYKNPSVKFETPECVMYSRTFDSHAIATVTIPIDGRYYVASFDWENPKINYYRAGSVIPRVQDVFRDTCPQFESLSKMVRK